MTEHIYVPLFTFLRLAGLLPAAVSPRDTLVFAVRRRGALFRLRRNFPLSFSFILTFALYTDFTGRPSSDEISAQLFPARIIEYTFRSYADSSPGSSALAERASSSPERPSDDLP